MHSFFTAVLSNAALAVVLGLFVVLIGRRVQRPALLHLLWIVVLLRLFMPPLFEFALLPAEETATVAVDVAVAGLVDPTGEPRGPEADWPALIGGALLALWGVGSVTMLGLSGVRQWRFNRMVLRPSDAELEARVRHLAELIGCARQPRVVLTDARMSPSVWSFLGRPTLILPTALLDGLRPAQRDTILAHELAHLKRGDDRVRWFELAALIIFWWNPITWVASRRLRDAEEACCDAIVTDTLPASVEDYARSLIHTIRYLMAPEPSPLVAASGLGRPAMMERRILTMFAPKSSKPFSVQARVLVAVVVGLSLGLSPMLAARTTDDVSGLLGHEPITLNLVDADLGDVLATFAKVAAVEIAIDPSISATVSVNVNEVPIDDVFLKMLQTKGLTATVSDGRIIVGRDAALKDAEAGEKSLKVEGELDGRPVYRFLESGTITEPKRIDGPNPVYPEQARKEGINGVVVMEAVVDETGRVREVEVLRSNADSLSESAVESLEQWIFEPATLEGVPVAVRYIVTVNFKLE